MKAYGGVEVHHSSLLHQMEVNGQLHTSATSHLAKCPPHTHCIEPRASVDAAEKKEIFYHSHESNPNSSANQLVPRHYTDLAILTLLIQT
jgi:hypothetical protein